MTDTVNATPCKYTKSIDSLTLIVRHLWIAVICLSVCCLSLGLRLIVYMQATENRIAILENKK